MATIYNWNPFGVALDITATPGTVTRKTATTFEVVVNASWETYYDGAKTNFGMTAASGGQTVTLNNFGTNASSGSKSFTGTYSISGNGAATKTITVTFRNFNTDTGQSATKNITFNVSVPAWTSYTIKYNANGGSGAPSSQTKWKGQNLILSNTKPTRTGYAFLGWATSANGSKAYNPGATYTADASVTLYAVWSAGSYKVTYNSNGGTGAPAAQTKTYNQALTLSSVKPTMTNHTFKGWGTSPSSTTVAYAPGASYTTNASVTLYAIWELSYAKPTVSKLNVYRCDSQGNPDDNGTYVKVELEATTYHDDAAVYVTIALDNGDEYGFDMESHIIINDILGEGRIDPDTTCVVSIGIDDTISVTMIQRTVPGSAYGIDFCHGDKGPGVAIGKPAEKSGVFEVALDNEFRGTTVQIGNRYTMSSPGVANTGGYIRMASIAITAANADTPITFVLTQRQTISPMILYVTFQNSTATASDISSFTYEGSNYGAFLVQTEELVWDLYVLKASNWDTITLQDWYTSRTMESRVSVTFPGDLVETLPTPYHRAIPAKLESLLDFIYPVGSVYISYSHVNPGSMFGGTWARIENAFLWGVDSSGTIGQTGGEKTHTLTLNELPAHTHGSVYSQNATGTKNLPWYSGTGDKLAYGTVSTGGGAAHNNMPPYIQVSIWRRTA